MLITCNRPTYPVIHAQSARYIFRVSRSFHVRSFEKKVVSNSNVMFFFLSLSFRAVLTAKLTSLEPRVHRGGDSGEDLTSDDCQTDEDLEGTEEERVEEYAVTFDLPGE